MEGVKNLESNPEEPCGVEGVERWDSRRGNRRGPSPPQQWDPWGAISRVDWERRAL